MPFEGEDASGDTNASILSSIAAYYASKLAEHGATSRGVDWNDPASHELRHRQFLRLFEGSLDASVLDLGCGCGDFLRFLRAEGYRGTFFGYDVTASNEDVERTILSVATKKVGVKELQRWLKSNSKRL